MMRELKYERDDRDSFHSRLTWKTRVTAVTECDKSLRNCLKMENWSRNRIVILSQTLCVSRFV